MATAVGTKGQIVIEKHIREHLGVRAGWRAVQVLADDHVEVYFIPPPHNRSLRGCLAPFVESVVPPEDSWDDLISVSISQDILEGLDGQP